MHIFNECSRSPRGVGDCTLDACKIWKCIDVDGKSVDGKRDKDSTAIHLQAYNDVRGRWNLGAFLLCIDHIQSDPFAPPSKFRLQVGRVPL